MIDQTLAPYHETEGEMSTADWMFYYADIFLEGVQYGHRTEMCQILSLLEYSNDPDALVLTMAEWGEAIGVTPPFYD